jgi:hypothetical protein
MVADRVYDIRDGKALQSGSASTGHHLIYQEGGRELLAGR